MVTKKSFCRSRIKRDSTIAIQKVLPIICIYGPIRLKECMKGIAIPKIEHGKSFFSCVNSDDINPYYGPLTISCLVATEAASLTVALASTVLSSSAYSCHVVAD